VLQIWRKGNEDVDEEVPIDGPDSVGGFGHGFNNLGPMGVAVGEVVQNATFLEKMRLLFVDGLTWPWILLLWVRRFVLVVAQVHALDLGRKIGTVAQPRDVQLARGLRSEVATYILTSFPIPLGGRIARLTNAS